MKVKLTYFKPRSGKYYADGEFETENKPLYQIWEDVVRMRDQSKLPGLTEGCSPKEYSITVDVPEHEHNHPKLIPYPYELMAAENLLSNADCDCGYVLPSHGYSNPEQHSKECKYRTEIAKEMYRLHDQSAIREVAS